MKLVLASRSPRRKMILKKFGIKFRTVHPKINEERVKKGIKSKNPYKIANTIAYEKAKSVLNKVKSGIILGSDTIVVLGKRIIGKPKSKKDAEKILKALSGSTHSVITSLAFIDAKTYKSMVTYDETRIKFRKMSVTKIKEYINNYYIMDKAGAYAIQEGADPFVKSYKGSYYNIVGLPIELVRYILRNWKKF